jgi:DNA repair photolyase
MFYTRSMGRPQYLEDTCKSALNRVPGESRLPFRWTVNPYRGCSHSCHYCFARAYHAYLDLGVGEDFSSKIVVKTNVVDVLRRELASPRWAGEAIAMGTATDPYQHCEGRYRLTRGIVEALAECANPLSLLTKSTLVLRDLDAFRRLNEVTSVTVSMSVAMLDERIRREVEPGTPPGRKRLEVLARFADAGIRTGVLVAPVLPALTDGEEQLDALLAACADAGVTSATAIPLHVRPAIRAHFMPWLERTYPWLYPRYIELYGRRTYAPQAYRRDLAERFARLRLRHGIGAGPPRTGTQATPRQPPRESDQSRQLVLAI